MPYKPYNSHMFHLPEDEGWPLWCSHYMTFEDHGASGFRMDFAIAFDKDLRRSWKQQNKIIPFAWITT